jgi:iron complex outermembrane receptor protein
MKISSVVLLCFLANVNFAYAESEFDEFEDEFGDFYTDADFISIATGTKTTLDKAPAIASVITADDMRYRGVRNLAEALATVPGINVSRSSQIMGPKFNFRGITSTFSPQTLLMVNGTPLKSVVRGDNHVSWGEYPIHSIARIEIIRGPGSALYGADAFAGVINIITKGAGAINKDSVGGSIGSFDSKSLWFNGAHKGQGYEIAVNAEYSQSEGYKEIIQIDAQSALDTIANDVFILPAVSLAPGSVNTSFEILDVFVRAKVDKFQFNMGLQERRDLGTGQGVTEALDPNGRVGGHKFIFDAIHETEEFQFGWKLRSKLSYYRSAQTIEEDLHLFPPGTFFGSFPDGLIGNPEWQEDNTSFNIKADNAAVNSHFISVGVGFARADLFEVTEAKNFYPDISPRPNGIEDVSDTSEAFMPEASRNSGFIYLQDIWQISPDWELTTGLRWDDYSDFDSTLNPRLALVWSTSLRSTTKLLYGRAFRAPSFAELLVTNNPGFLGNPNLSPEVIDTYEISYSIKTGQSMSLNINAFYYQIDDFITFTPDAGSSSSTAQNVGKREGHGLEVESSVDLSEKIRLKANYSYVKAKDKLLKDDVGDYPNHQLNAVLDWDVNSYWHLNLMANLVGERLRTPHDNRSSLDGFTNLSLNVSYRDTSNGVEISLSAKNLLDDDIYEPSTGPSSTGGVANIPFDLPQAGVSVYLTASKEF